MLFTMEKADALHGKMERQGVLLTLTNRRSIMMCGVLETSSRMVPTMHRTTAAHWGIVWFERRVRFCKWRRLKSTT
ncbi:MAG: hypothetical protein BYD32DRAFT_413127 [Podila humilis]|nr:MAG: hypothetical protein BYD32DRAFT_413127 [Podila humilis]